MSISQELIDTVAQVIQHMCSSNKTISYKEIARVILETDEIFRATHQPAAPGGDEEPELPEGVVYERPEDGCPARYYHTGRCEHSSIWRDDWTPEQLEAIARHMRYMDRQRTREQEAKPAVTDAMVERVAKAGFYGSSKHPRSDWDSVSACFKPGFLDFARAAITEALEAQRSEARKVGKS